jgi:tRNA A-37 threonylcarbamoyl transferase component Bud32
MSEERFDRLESQISELRELMQQNMVVTQQNIAAINQNMAAMNQNINAIREDVIALRQRIDSVEGSQNVIIREGFQSLMSYNDDLNYELSDNTRQTRLLKRRIIRLERKDKED